ncbi:MAG TPA: MATE family efflux transporter [Chloroflexi bacterium]|nr:MATE family efflux transporter [Chloroflexota bacterium]
MSGSEAAGRDLTSGNLHRNIWYLAGPMILETGIQNVTQLLDTYWVGRLGSDALAAVTISITIRWVFNSLANGLGIGGLAVVARRIGEKDADAASHAVWQTILLGLGVSFALSIPALLLARPLLKLLGADATVLPLGISFLRVILGGLFTVVLVFVINALLRGAGEAQLAMRVLFLATAVNVVLEPILIFGWGPWPALGVTGSAWANVVGFGAGLLWQTLILLSGKARIHINPRDLRPDFPVMGRIIRIALPSTVQMFLRSSSRLVIIGLVGAFGTFATAGYGVANRLLLIVLIPGFGLANAASTLVGQNLGAQQPKRAESSAWWVSAYGATYMAAFSMLLFVFARPLIHIFDPTLEVVEIGATALRIVAPSLIASALGIVLARSFDGAGDTVPAMMINLFTLWGIETTLSLILSRWTSLGLTGIWWARTLANVANGLLLAIWFRIGRWKRRKV